MDNRNDLFWKLVEPEHLKARAFCRKLAGNRDEGDDLYQDSLVKALTGLAKLRDHNAFRPWLYRIIVNIFRGRAHKSFWKRYSSLDDKALKIPDNSDLAASQAVKRRLSVALNALSPENHALIVLHDVEGWGIEELSRMFGKSQGNIRTRLSRSRKQMQKALTRFFNKSDLSELKKTIQSEEKICVAVKSAKD
ncbi:MAG: sigma-70 family RNA polymerase sigma factor [candidate division Zixibacteria bacterium]|nr:sigma-70 family RNA polymerase sigma factor [candidate division Zixibacteria bacterium]